MVTQATGINTTLGHRTTNPLRALNGCRDHGPQTWPRVATHATYIGSPSNPFSRQQSLKTLPRHQAVAEMLPCVHMCRRLHPAQGSSMGRLHLGGPSRGSDPESELFLILGLHHCPELGVPTAGKQVRGLSLYLFKHQAVVYHPANPTGQWQYVSLRALSHLSLPITSPVPPLSVAHVFSTSPSS